MYGHFYADIARAHSAQVEITDANTVTREGTRNNSLFSLELLADETNGIEYNQAFPPEVYPKAVLDAFDAALVSTGAIGQVEHQVMPHLLKNSTACLQTVSNTEPACRANRERVEVALLRWLPKAAEYLATYEKYLPFVKKTVQEHVDELSGEEVPLKQIQQELMYHLGRVDEVVGELPKKVSLGLFDISTNQVRDFLSNKHRECATALQQLVATSASAKCTALCDEMKAMCSNVMKPLRSPEHAQEQRQYFKDVTAQVEALQPQIAELPAYYEVLDEFFYLLSDDEDRLRWQTYTWPMKMAEAIETGIEKCEEAENLFQNQMIGEQKQFEQEIGAMNNIVVGYAGHTDFDKLEKIAADTKKYKMRLSELETRSKTYNMHEAIFGLPTTDYSNLTKIVKEFEPYEKMWAAASMWTTHHELWMTGSFLDLDAEAIEKEVLDANKLLMKVGKQFSTREGGEGCAKICETVRAQMDEFKPILPMLIALRNPGMQDRHWEKLSEDIGQPIKPDKHFKLEDCIRMGLTEPLEAIEKVGEVAGKEYMLEQALTGMYGQWEGVLLEILDYRETGTFIVKGSEETIQQIDDQITMTQAIGFSPFKGVFEQDIADWDRKLNTVSEVIDEWLACQRNWMYLEPIFSSDDIQKQLPLESTRFNTVDQKWRKNMALAKKNPSVVGFCANEKLLVDFQESNKLLELVSKGLNDYLETKRAGFARFYFLSNDELLEILSQTKDPRAVQPHLRKCFEAIAKLKFEDDLAMTQMISGEGEVVDFASPLYPKGNVEDWLTQVEIMMQRSVRLAMKNALESYYDCPRTEWVKNHPAMCVINGSQYFWTLELEEKITASGAIGVKEYYQQALDQITDLIGLVRGQLTKQQRNSIGALIVVEVHARDVVLMLV